MQLLVGPFALGLIGFWLTVQQHVRQQRIENQRPASDQAVEKRRAKQATVQTYLDQMGVLLLDRDLRNASETCGVRRVARARTLMMLGAVQTT